MRVGINVSILSSRLTGVGYYTLALLQALGRVEKEIEFVLLGVSPELDGLMPHAENIQVREVRGLGGAGRIAWEQRGLPQLALAAGVDVLHCPDISRPVLSPVPVINTIHDLSFYLPRPNFTLGKRLYKKFMCRSAIKRSERIIAVSNFTREEILRRFRIDQQKVVVVHNGVEFLPGSTPRENVLPFLLFVGTLEERKDVVTLVRAFGLLRGRGRFRHRLVLVGQRGYGWGKIRAAIEACPFRQDIEVRGYEKREEVARLYRAAEVFVYPSTYEGFGFPVLEAMACGTPVVCSRAASLPEVAGDAAEFFQPSNAVELAAAIEKVLESPELQASLRHKGLERAKVFSWDECARRHCEVYRSVRA